MFPTVIKIESDSVVTHNRMWLPRVQSDLNVAERTFLFWPFEVYTKFIPSKYKMGCWQSMIWFHINFMWSTTMYQWYQSICCCVNCGFGQIVVQITWTSDVTVHKVLGNLCNGLFIGVKFFNIYKSFAFMFFEEKKAYHNSHFLVLSVLSLSVCPLYVFMIFI